MPMAERRATVVWQGDLKSGRGTIESGSGALRSLPVTFPARLESDSATTSPEELIAAAHATCYSMVLANTLASNGHQPEHLEVEARCQVERTDRGLVIRRVTLNASARVPGLDTSAFHDLARKAEQSCPVSNAFRGNLEIELKANLLTAVR